MDDWMGASLWRLGQTAEDRLMYGRSVKAATSGNGSSEREVNLTFLSSVCTPSV